jgi:predicted ribosome quality control (RQC) complex YloA/Tae2 family protein
MQICENIYFHYIIKEEERKVIAIVRNHSVNVLLSNTSKVSGIVLEDIKVGKIKTVAKCCPSDTFNAELGKKIARKKALRRLFVKIKNDVKNELLNAQETIDSLSKTLFETEKKIERVDEFLKYCNR